MRPALRRQERSRALTTPHVASWCSCMPRPGHVLEHRGAAAERPPLARARERRRGPGARVAAQVEEDRRHPARDELPARGERLDRADAPPPPPRRRAPVEPADRLARAPVGGEVRIVTLRARCPGAAARAAAPPARSDGPPAGAAGRGATPPPPPRGARGRCGPSRAAAARGTAPAARPRAGRGARAPSPPPQPPATAASTAAVTTAVAIRPAQAISPIIIGTARGEAQRPR